MEKYMLDRLQGAIEFFYVKNEKENLNNIYKKVPSGECSGCGSCCNESVGAYYGEFLNILSGLEKKSLEDRKKIYIKIFEYYLGEYSVKRQCPFLQDDKRCSIYDERPLNCRIYGHWKKSEYEQNYNRVLKENRLKADYLKRERGFSIPSEIVEYKIEWCKNFKGKIMTKAERNLLYDEMISIDSKYFATGNFPLEYADRGIVEYFVEFFGLKESIDILKFEKISRRKKERIYKVAILKMEELLWKCKN